MDYIETENVVFWGYLRGVDYLGTEYPGGRSKMRRDEKRQGCFMYGVSIEN